MIVSDKTSVKDKVLGLTLGADDYVTKPFDKEELWVRVEILLKRSGHLIRIMDNHPTVNVGDLVIHPMARDVRVGGEKIKCTPKEFDLLYLLATNPGKVLGRNELLKKVWGKDFTGSIRTVDSHVKNIREKLMKFGMKCIRIETVWGVGYKLDKEDGVDQK